MVRRLGGQSRKENTLDRSPHEPEIGPLLFMDFRLSPDAAVSGALSPCPHHGEGTSQILHSKHGSKHAETSLAGALG